jgi:magnesium chelatase family protein
VNVINLAPADICKEGSALDLPIALGLLAASDQMSGTRFDEYLLSGELALDGTLRPVSGALCIAIVARDQERTGILLPLENVDTAGVVPGINVIPVKKLREAVDFINGDLSLRPHRTDLNRVIAEDENHVPDFTDVKVRHK